MFNFFKKKTTFSGIRSLLEDHINQLEEKKVSIPSDVFDVTRFAMEEILGTFESMDTLMEKNDFEGCLKLSRSILENAVNLEYIYKEDTEKRAKNFKLAPIRKLVEKFETLNDFTPEAKEMRDRAVIESKDYIPEKNMREKFKAIGSDRAYVRSYKRLSEYVHPMYRPGKLDFNEPRPYIMEMRRTVLSDTSLVTLMALQDVCVKYDLDGGIMIIDDPGYEGTIVFATNSKNVEEDVKRVMGKKVKK